MIIYKSTAADFRNVCFTRSISAVIEESFKQATHRSVGQSELNSWGSSLQHVAIALNDKLIPDDAGVAVEYTIPQSCKRMDFIISGYGEDRKSALIIVELKQWSTSRATDKDGILLARRGGTKGETEGTHPSYQAWSYAALLKGFNEAVYSSGMDLRPCAYLHNHPPNGAIDSPFYKDHIELAPLFLQGDAERERLRRFIAQHVKYGDSGKVIEEVEGGRIRPSKALADSLSKMLRGNQEFILIDDQKVVFESVCSAVSSSSETCKKVVIIEGGPGTGKSVVAINLLVELTKRGLLSKYVSKNAAPRAVYRSNLSGTLRQNEISNLFSGSGAFIDTEPNTFHALLIDEAHRLNEKSGLYGNLGENQIKELISAAKCTVFFIDESQRITLADIGRVAEIRKWAADQGASVSTYELASQFRCNGSDGYVAWLDNLLEIRETANETLDTASYDFRVFDSPTELHELIKELNLINNRARVVAGYCWEWASKTSPLAFDIVLEEGHYQKQWNLTQDGSLWIISPNSVEEVGCIHTCQGLEVEYIGVIIGPDLIVRNGKVQTDYKKRARVDQRKSLPGIKQMHQTAPAKALAAADEIIKNTYRTLMTRGMKGCYVYSSDPETREYFAGRLRAEAK
jgi:hypothetical protein